MIFINKLIGKNFRDTIACLECLVRLRELNTAATSLYQHQRFLVVYVVGLGGE